MDNFLEVLATEFIEAGKAARLLELLGQFVCERFKVT